MKFFLSTLFLITFFYPLLSQESATVIGSVRDSRDNAPVDFATVYVLETNKVTETDDRGFYGIQVPAGSAFALVFTRVGYRQARVEVPAMPAGGQRRINVVLAPELLGPGVEVIDSRIEDAGMINEEVEALKLLPNASGNFESVLPAIALGTSGGTGGELSSQYNVRGGNYDENLVYVNDFEIYRPQLVRAGQQEGLSFPNIDLISNLSFSSGGFEARYGDKLSSVLDIRYKRPDSLRASVGLSLLGASAHLEGSVQSKKSSYRKWRYLLGARYKNNRYILGSLDVEGEYTPNFTDVQAYITYDLSRDWQLGILGNYNRSVYRFIPQSRSTAFGLIDFALELSTVFEGGEIDDFTTYMGGLSLTFLPEGRRNPFFLKFLASANQIEENERFDILGFYRLGQLESNLGSDDFGDVVNSIGTGTQQEFVRNYLVSNVANLEHKGGLEIVKDHPGWTTSSSHFLQWGARYQYEQIDDEINEWERLDSAGYSLPFDPARVLVSEVFKSENDLRSNRLSAYFQDTYTWRRDSIGEIQLTGGVRAAYWDLNGEFFVTPRFQLLYKPLSWKRDFSFRLAAGMYFQPPFYRELRNPAGVVNTDVLAQKSLHVLGGFTHDFFIGKKQPQAFRLIVEAYYKHLWDLVSYEIDNVRIRYAGDNDATGYVAGIDMRLNGEFVPGVESWINLSFLRAREALDGIQHQRRDIGDTEARNVKDAPRPTDQFMTLSMFFQDYLPQNENFQMQLNLTVGTGLPFGLEDNNRVFRNTYRFPAYHRVDIGFSFQLYERSWRARHPNHFLGFSRSAWASLEVFNLLEVQNTASNTWIKSVFNVQYAVPDFLTSRRINLRLRFEF